MGTVAVKIFLPEHLQEFLIAELADLDFESFEEADDYVLGYIPSPRWSDVKREQIESWLNANDIKASITEEVVADRNWNQLWEETIGPVAVPPFLVKPTWREVPFEHRELVMLEIDPKMSFGTGYHESTRLMLRLIPDAVKAGDRVLDAGTGTGILAIAAIKFGAASATAFDIDPWSQENAVENFYINGVKDRIDMVLGGIEHVLPGEYDVVLANINLNVILGLLPEFAGRLARGGVLLLSGVLISDRARVVSEAEKSGFRLTEEQRENEWWAGSFRLTR